MTNKNDKRIRELLGEWLKTEIQREFKACKKGGNHKDEASHLNWHKDVYQYWIDKRIMRAASFMFEAGRKAGLLKDFWNKEQVRQSVAEEIVKGIARLKKKKQYAEVFG